MPELAYVGAMGSRRTHEDRERRLREVGLGDVELARLSSPIGLDLGARTPEETAISIAAEIIALRWGGSGEPLAQTEGRIHHDWSLSRESEDPAGRGDASSGVGAPETPARAGKA
jgi:xanthine dehydrogenase accessory factor